MEQPNLSRRSFLGGALALTAAAALPASAWASAPMIYGDGVHDDTAGLQAALDGNPFRVRGGGCYVMKRHGEVFIGKGDFCLSKPLRLGGNVRVTIRDCRMKWDSLAPSTSAIMVSGGGHYIANCLIETNATNRSSSSPIFVTASDS